MSWGERQERLGYTAEVERLDVSGDTPQALDFARMMALPVVIAKVGAIGGAGVRPV